MLTVMVVDDDPLLCTAMRRKIEMIDRENQLGIQETLIAHSAQEAWGILQEKSVFFDAAPPFFALQYRVVKYFTRFSVPAAFPFFSSRAAARCRWI